MVSSLANVFRRESTSSREEVPFREVSEDSRKRRSGFFRRFSLGRKSTRLSTPPPKSDSEDENQQKIEVLLTEIKMLEISNQKYYKMAKEEMEKRLATENELLKVRIDIDRAVNEQKDLRRQVRILKVMVENEEKRREFQQRKRLIPKALSKENIRRHFRPAHNVAFSDSNLYSK